MPTTLPEDNPFASRSRLPFQLPPFADLRDEHYRPALEAGLAAERAEVEAIAANPDAPTFENTLVALEGTGELLHRVTAVMYNLSSSDATPFLDALEEEFAPRFAEHSDRTFQDSRLAARVEAVANDPSLAERSAEDRRLAEETLRSFRRAGAFLDDAAKARVAELNARLSSVSTRFEQNLLADTNDLALVVGTREELAGLADDEIEAAAEAARERGLEGRFLVSLVLPTIHPHLASLERRDVRRRLHEAQIGRGSRGNEHDNRELALEMVRLRAERAELLGSPSHAAFIAERGTAGSVEAIRERLAMLAPAAARNARREQEILQAMADAEQDAKGEPRFEIEAWDWSYYAEKARARDYAVDTAAMRPYFEAERVLQDGVFGAATRIYGIRFAERPDLVGYHPDVRVFEVTNEDGSPVGLYLLDLYTRDAKRGGAWMNDFVQQNALEGTPTVVVNVLNVPRPPEGTPTLLTYDEVNTLFHEFGHALHGLFAQVTYPSFGGTNVPRDFVEFPSQVNEMWMLWPEVVGSYARHHETGEPLPAEQIERLRKASLWGEGQATSEYLAAAILDQAWHSLGADEARAVTDVAEFERRALAAAGLDLPAVPTRYSTPYFQHIFAGGYSAGYYSYIWSEVLDADTVEWFTERDGATRENGERFRERLLGVGGSKDPLEAYRDFRGRDARIEPLLERRGLGV